MSSCGNYKNCLRISFGYLKKEEITIGLNSLCDGIQDYMKLRNL